MPRKAPQSLTMMPASRSKMAIMNLLALQFFPRRAQKAWLSNSWGTRQLSLLLEPQPEQFSRQQARWISVRPRHRWSFCKLSCLYSQRQRLRHWLAIQRFGLMKGWVRVPGMTQLARQSLSVVYRSCFSSESPISFYLRGQGFVGLDRWAIQLLRE